MAHFVKTLVPSETRIVLASGDEFDLSGAEGLLLDGGTLEVSYPRKAAHPDLVSGPPRAIYLSSSEWRQVISMAPTREVQIAEGLERKRLETIEGLEDQLLRFKANPGSNATVIAALTRMLAELKHEA